MHAIVHAADIQDRDGGVLLVATLFGLHPFLLTLYADGGYAGLIFLGSCGHPEARFEQEVFDGRAGERDGGQAPVPTPRSISARSWTW